MTTKTPGLTFGLPIPWDALELVVSSDTARRARYRALQSRYREDVLGVGVGLDASGKARGNMLPVEAVTRNQGLNFLSPEVSEYVEARARVVIGQGGTLEEDRLLRNMLSSMPLCFNLFGFLRLYPMSAARLLSGVLGLDIAVIRAMEVEWTPAGPHPLRDRTAFDAYVEYLTSDGKAGMLGIETKYTEPFSREEYDRESYRQWTTVAQGFLPDAAETLKSRDTNQLWRNLLLVKAVKDASRFDYGHVVVVALAGDSGAERAIAGVAGQLEAPEECVRGVTLEALLEAAHRETRLREWAERFIARYLGKST